MAIKQIMQMVRPKTHGVDLDDPNLTVSRKSILQKKNFLRSIYMDWYQTLTHFIPEGNGAVVELGSGAGFLDESYPTLIQSDILWIPSIDLVMDGRALPFAKESVKAIVMTNVLHHIPDACAFFNGAKDCLVPGGVIAMVEPWNSAWSGWIYRNLHHEPFFPESPTWEFQTSGPLSGANGALPWILFERDREQFFQMFPQFQLKYLNPVMPLRYLMSGGFSTRELAPGWSYPAWRLVERLFWPIKRHFNMFAEIIIQRK
ncbi:MAG: methyltransferase domain-containing protein [Anaerolineaceae bacterium]|nr:methyltransferase domain-containing protein [Anaerolineaceae bacterium]